MLSIDKWFVQYAYRPIIFLVNGLYFLFLAATFLMYHAQVSDNKIFLNQSSKHLLLAINQKNRSQVDTIISSLSKLDAVNAVALCDNEKILVNRRGDASFCSTKNYFNFDSQIVGNETYFLRVRFKNIFLSLGVILGLVTALVGALSGNLILRQFKKKFEQDILEKVKNITKTEGTFLIQELKNISIEICESQENKINIQKQKILTDLSKQVSHDIRSPLAALNFMISSQTYISDHDKNIMSKALSRINMIAEDLLLEDRSNAKGALLISDDKVLIYSFLEDIIKEKQLEYNKFELVSINLKNQINKKTQVVLSQSAFGRILSNLINNSLEAMAYKGTVEIVAKEVNNKIHIEVIDQGGGIPQEFFQNLKNNITTKKNGNGLGLSHAISTLQKYGSINFKNINNGLTVSIVLNKLNFKADAVLVDNDELSRMIWEMKAKSKGLEILTFESYSKFLEIKKEIDISTPIYLDSDLGDNLRGEELASALYSEGFNNLFMTTGFPAEKFAEYSFLKDVISKSPPF